MPFPTKHGQRGIALLLFVFIVISVGATLFLSTWNGTRARQEQERNSTMALQLAKESLIAYAAVEPDINSAGYLPLPDLGIPIYGALQEGTAAGDFSENRENHSVVGKLPWRTLDAPPLYDRHGECLWYIVSGRFKNTQSTVGFNWDTQGQIDIINDSGTLVASNIAAMVVAPGLPLDGQSRVQSDPAHTRCGGNYAASNYLDPINAANAIAGQVNYFAGSTNDRVASNDGNKQFVMAAGPHFNDQFMWITVDDIFRPIIRRRDFAALINGFLSNPDFVTYLQSLAIAGTKGTDHLDCGMAPNPTFCNNWKEMFFITQLRDDEARPPNCARVIIFAGQKTLSQNRTTAADKLNKRNYLEEPNRAAFDTPTAASNNFTIAPLPIFVPDEPWKDIVHCLPAAA